MNILDVHNNFLIHRKGITIVTIIIYHLPYKCLICNWVTSIDKASESVVSTFIPKSRKNIMPLLKNIGHGWPENIYMPHL